MKKNNENPPSAWLNKGNKNPVWGNNKNEPAFKKADTDSVTENKEPETSAESQTADADTRKAEHKKNKEKPDIVKPEDSKTNDTAVTDADTVKSKEKTAAAEDSKEENTDGQSDNKTADEKTDNKVKENNTVPPENNKNAADASDKKNPVNWATEKKNKKKENIIKENAGNSNLKEVIDRFGRNKFIMIISSVFLALVIAICVIVLSFEFHIWGNHVWTAATCETPITCEGCGKTVGSAFGHNWSKADCTNPQVCLICGAESGEPAGHELSEADCEKASVCSICKMTVGDPLGHDWSGLDCEKAQKCLRCGKEREAAAGHKWVKATCEKPKTCSACGKTEGKANGHKWKEANCKQPKTCSVCKKTEGGLGDHSWKPANLKDPKTCRICGKTEGSKLDYTSIGIGVIITDDANGLNLREEPKADAAKVLGMSETGIVSVYSCNNPNWYYVEYDGEYGYAKSEFIVIIPKYYYPSYSYSSVPLDKIISADIDSDNEFEIMAYYSKSGTEYIVTYDGKSQSGEFTNDGYSYSYHLIKDNNINKVYFGCVYQSYDYGYIEKVSPRYESIISYGNNTQTLADDINKFDEYMKKITYVDDDIRSNSSYNYGHWVDYAYTVN